MHDLNVWMNDTNEQMIQMKEWTTEWNECGKAWEIIRTTLQSAIFSSLGQGAHEGAIFMVKSYSRRKK